MGDLTRRDMLATAAVAGGMLAGASGAIAETGDRAVQPSRAPGIGGYDPVPGNPIRERQNPHLLQPPPPATLNPRPCSPPPPRIPARYKTSVSLLLTRMCGSRAAAGPAR